MKIALLLLTVFSSTLAQAYDVKEAFCEFQEYTSQDENLYVEVHRTSSNKYTMSWSAGAMGTPRSAPAKVIYEGNNLVVSRGDASLVLTKGKPKATFSFFDEEFGNMQTISLKCKVDL